MNDSIFLKNSPNQKNRQPPTFSQILTITYATSVLAFILSFYITSESDALPSKLLVLSTLPFVMFGLLRYSFVPNVTRLLIKITVVAVILSCIQFSVKHTYDIQSTAEKPQSFTMNYFVSGEATLLEILTGTFPSDKISELPKKLKLTNKQVTSGFSFNVGFNLIFIWLLVLHDLLVRSKKLKGEFTKTVSLEAAKKVVPNALNKVQGKISLKEGRAKNILKSKKLGWAMVWLVTLSYIFVFMFHANLRSSVRDNLMHLNMALYRSIYKDYKFRVTNIETSLFPAEITLRDFSLGPKEQPRKIFHVRELKLTTEVFSNSLKSILFNDLKTDFILGQSIKAEKIKISGEDLSNAFLHAVKWRKPDLLVEQFLKDLPTEIILEDFKYKSVTPIKRLTRSQELETEKFHLIIDPKKRAIASFDSQGFLWSNHDQRINKTRKDPIFGNNSFLRKNSSKTKIKFRELSMAGGDISLFNVLKLGQSLEDAPRLMPKPDTIDFVNNKNIITHFKAKDLRVEEPRLSHGLSSIEYQVNDYIGETPTGTSWSFDEYQITFGRIAQLFPNKVSASGSTKASNNIYNINSSINIENFAKIDQNLEIAHADLQQALALYFKAASKGAFEAGPLEQILENIQDIQWDITVFDEGFVNRLIAADVIALKAHTFIEQTRARRATSRNVPFKETAYQSMQERMSKSIINSLKDFDLKQKLDANEHLITQLVNAPSKPLKLTATANDFTHLMKVIDLKRKQNKLMETNSNARIQQFGQMQIAVNAALEKFAKQVTIHLSSPATLSDEASSYKK